jgi:uncharacterized protein YheU (UPF0270 family)
VPALVDPKLLAAETLDNLIDDLIYRDNTEHLETAELRQQKKQALLKSLQSGKHVIVFDEDSESCSIVDSAHYPGSSSR